MNRLSRATALRTAAILSCLYAFYGIVMALPYLARGAADLNQSADGVPYFIVVLGLVLSVVEIVSAYGGWQNQRWGIVLTVLAHILDTLAAVPGILFAPTLFLRIGSIIGTVVGLVIIVLCLWRERKVITG